MRNSQTAHNSGGEMSDNKPEGGETVHRHPKAFRSLGQIILAELRPDWIGSSRNNRNSLNHAGNLANHSVSHLARHSAVRSYDHNLAVGLWTDDSMGDKTSRAVSFRAVARQTVLQRKKRLNVATTTPTTTTRMATPLPTTPPRPTPSTKNLRLTLAEIARRSYEDRKTVNQASEESWKTGIAHSMAERTLTNEHGHEARVREPEERLSQQNP